VVGRMYIKTNLLEVGCDSEYWLELDWDRTKIQACVDTVTDLSVLQKTGIY
jgi:hypothetical protein